MDATKTTTYVEDAWQRSVIPALQDYIKIEALSPYFDKEWAAHGHLDAAVELAADWVRGREVPGLSVEILRLPGRTPVLLLEREGSAPGTVMLYGHLDKQPEGGPWRSDLGPWKPVLEGDRLYGRGGADDGYAVFASTVAIEAMLDQGAPTPRIVGLIECSEESGSPDLEAYIVELAERIGTPDLVICLDSGAGDYDRLWMTTSLRGNLVADLRIDVLREGVHSGDASGVVPSSFRVARILLNRLENVATGEIRVKELQAEITAETRRQVEQAAAILGDATFRDYPFIEGMESTTTDPVEATLNRTWRAQLSVTGQGGMPDMGEAGNVLRPYTELKLSLRLPPTVSAETAGDVLERVLLADPPYGARVTLEGRGPADGWGAPSIAPWLQAAVDGASEAFFGSRACARGEGGTIPFMSMLGQRFPNAQFLITGVLGPESNAHGPNEFLHLPTAMRLTAATSHVLEALAEAAGA